MVATSVILVAPQCQAVAVLTGIAEPSAVQNAFSNDKKHYDKRNTCLYAPSNSTRGVAADRIVSGRHIGLTRGVRITEFTSHSIELEREQ